MRNSNRVKRSKRVVSSGRNHWHGGSAKRPRKTVTHTGWISMFREVSKKSFCFLSFSLGSLWHWFFVIPNLNSVISNRKEFWIEKSFESRRSIHRRIQQFQWSFHWVRTETQCGQIAWINWLEYHWLEYHEDRCQHGQRFSWTKESALNVFRFEVGRWAFARRGWRFRGASAMTGDSSDLGKQHLAGTYWPSTQIAWSSWMRHFWSKSNLSRSSGGRSTGGSADGTLLGFGGDRHLLMQSKCNRNAKKEKLLFVKLLVSNSCCLKHLIAFFV